MCPVWVCLNGAVYTVHSCCFTRVHLIRFVVYFETDFFVNHPWLLNKTLIYDRRLLKCFYNWEINCICCLVIRPVKYCYCDLLQLLLWRYCFLKNLFSFTIFKAFLLLYFLENLLPTQWLKKLEKSIKSKFDKGSKSKSNVYLASRDMYIHLQFQTLN